MTSRVLKSADDLPAWGRYLRTRSFPMTVTAKDGADRSHDQNALAFKWFKEIGQQLDGWEASGARAYCKLNIGVAMLHAENEDFREQWDRLIKGRFTHEELLDLMLPPARLPRDQDHGNQANDPVSGQDMGDVHAPRCAVD